ncbi:MAG: DUF4920 domain-containing protein [Phycisphaerae bacterium]
MRIGNLIATAVLATFLGGCAAPMAKFGETMKLTESDTVPLAKVLASPDQYNGKLVRVSGTVSEVCESMGCWLRLKDPAASDTLFVKFTCPTEGRLIPLEAIGRRATVEGTLKVETITQEEARHHKEESGASEAEIAKIVGPQRLLRMSAPAALVEGIAQPKPVQ